jgi:hypothetical protein
MTLLHADVAQLVEHHLAKVRVAGSSPVVRSLRCRLHRAVHFGSRTISLVAVEAEGVQERSAFPHG